MLDRDRPGVVDFLACLLAVTTNRGGPIDPVDLASMW
jgi:hypothetical protein